MDPFTQAALTFEACANCHESLKKSKKIITCKKLLERTQARKEALAKKRQEAQQLPSNSSSPSSKSRQPLTSRNDNRRVNQNKDLAKDTVKHPVAKPRTDNPRERSVVSSHLKPANRSSPHKNSERKDGHNNKKRESGEGSGVDNVKEKKARLQSKGNLSDGHTPKSVSTGETLQERLERLRAQNKRGEEDVAEIRKKRQWELEDQQRLRANLYGGNRNKRNQDEVKRLSASVEDKAAIFESKPSKKESSVKSRSAELKHFTNETAKRDCANDKRYVKTYAIYKETETQQNNIRGGKQNGYEISGMNIDDSEVFEDSHSGDEEMDESSDENPFDVSEILREADKAERRKTMAKAAAEKKAILQNDCKSRNVNDNDKMDIPSITRTDSSSEDIVNEDELSDFAKLVAQKQKLLKSPIQQENLHKLDKNIDGKKNLRPSNEEVLVNNEGTRGEKTSGDDMKNNRNYKGVAEMEKKRTDRPINRDMQKETTSVSESIKRAREQENRESSVVSERKTPSKELQKTPNKSTDQRRNSSTPRFMFSKRNIRLIRFTTSVSESIKRAREQENRESSVVSERKTPSKELQKTPNKSTDQRRNSSTPRFMFSKRNIRLIRFTTSVSESIKRAREQENRESSVVSERKTPSKELQKTPNKTKRNAPEPPQDTDPNLVFSPDSKTYKSVREKSASKPRKNLRRSMSVGEGSRKTVHKSAYNEEQSSKYNVVTNVKAEEVRMSVNEKIQDLLEEAASQQNIVLQTSQALNVCLNAGEDRRGNPEVVEGEKFLLLATERRTACLEEVQRLKQQPQTGNQRYIGSMGEEAVPPYQMPCKANLIISEMKIPLHNDFLIALRGGKMDLGVFHFIVHIQYGPTQIQSTHVTSTYDELVGNTLCYNSRLELKDVPHDFVITVKVFGMHTKKGDTVTRNKKQAALSKQSKDSPGIMKNIVSSLTPRRRINSDASPGGESPQKTVFRNSSFILVGESRLNIALIKAGKHVLTKVPSNCPLEGFIQFHADLVPQFTAHASGFLTLFEDVGGYTTWNRRWSVLHGNTVSFWRYPDDENKPPIGSVDLKYCVNNYVTLVPRDECSRPNTFELILKRPLRRDDVPSIFATISGGEITTKLWISADNKEDRISWLDTLNCQLSDYKAWSIKPLGTKLGNIHSKDVYMCSQGSKRTVPV